MKKRWKPSFLSSVLLYMIYFIGFLGFGKWLTRIFLRQGNKYAPKLKPMAFEGYQPTKHDVFVCTYSKSGTNWMLQLVTQAIYGGKAEFEHIHKLVPWPDTPFPSLVSSLYDPTYKISENKLRAIKTHLEEPWVPMSSEAKYIVVLRDPKDVFVSFYHFQSGIIGGGL